MLLHMRHLLPLVVLFGCAGEEPEPPFNYRVSQYRADSVVDLLDLTFDNYSAAEASGTYLVQMTDGSASKTIELSIGRCRDYPCTGPLKAEYIGLQLSASPLFPDHVASFTCIGLHGLHSFSGVDGSGEGACD